MSIAMEDEPRPHLITVEEFHRMKEVGLLDPDARLELIEGVIIDMARIGSPHGSVVDALNERLMFALTRQAIVRIQGALELNRTTECLPDVALLKRRAGRYFYNQPMGLDTHLVIEVSDTSLRYDRNTKVPLYARYGVPEVWIADVANNTLHFFRARTDVGYSDISSTDSPGITPLPSLGGTVDLTGLFEPG